MTAEQQPRVRFFMAEDNPGDVILLRSAIQEVGLIVDLEVAADGAIAVSRLLDGEHPVPDLIILNFNLPKLQGHEVLTRIKATPRLLGVPVVMLTSSGVQRDRLLCKTADAYFVKSGDYSELLKIVAHLQQLVESRHSKRTSDQVELAADAFWQQGEQGASGAQGTGLKPIADQHLTKADERKFVGEELDPSGRNGGK